MLKVIYYVWWFQGEEVLNEYLQRKASIGEAILSADQSLTEAEQRAEGDIINIKLTSAKSVC
jgi:hypothetical protein